MATAQQIAAWAAGAEQRGVIPRRGAGPPDWQAKGTTLAFILTQGYSNKHGGDLPPSDAAFIAWAQAPDGEFPNLRRYWPPGTMDHNADGSPKPPPWDWQPMGCPGGAGCNDADWMNHAPWPSSVGATPPATPTTATDRYSDAFLSSLWASWIRTDFEQRNKGGAHLTPEQDRDVAIGMGVLQGDAEAMATIIRGWIAAKGNTMTEADFIGAVRTAGVGRTVVAGSGSSSGGGGGGAGAGGGTGTIGGVKLPTIGGVNLGDPLVLGAGAVLLAVLALGRR
jgi:hypothetical protein